MTIKYRLLQLVVLRFYIVLCEYRAGQLLSFSLEVYNSLGRENEKQRAYGNDGKNCQEE